MTPQPSSLEHETRAFWSAEVRRHVLAYPDEAVVRFLAGMAPDRAVNSGRAALDVGCGSGRHMRLLAAYGFGVTGVDLSREALDVAAEALQGLDVQLVHGSMEQIEPPAQGFHCLLGYGAFMYRPLHETRRDLARCVQLLAPHGVALINFRPSENWFCGLGEPLGGGFWRLDQRAGSYAGASYLFIDTDRSAALLQAAGFEIVNSERVELWKDSAVRRNVWDVYWVRRPA